MPRIHNDNNVYVLGAGFSAPRGLPVIANFMFALRDAHEWLTTQGRLDEANAVEQVVDFRRSSTPSAYRVQLDLENIEELFSLASATGDSLLDAIRIAIASTLDFRLSTIKRPFTTLRPNEAISILPAHWTSRGPDDPRTEPRYQQYSVDMYEFFIAGLLGMLATGQVLGTNTFITLNYDTLVEEALHALSVPFSYGFAPQHVAKDTSAERLGVSGDPTVRVLKLHGSTSWGATQEAGTMTLFGSYSDVRERRCAPELIPPTWRKSFTAPLASVWQDALIRFSEATRIVVIGFSLPPTDLHFKYLLAAGLRENISLREIVFVNYDQETIQRRAVDLFGDLSRRPQIRFVTRPIGQFVWQGYDHVASVGRPMHGALQGLSHSV